MKNNFLFILVFSCCVLPFTAFSQHIVPMDTSIHITLKEHDIYYERVKVGYYKELLIDTELTSLVIYNTSKARVAEATHGLGDESWTILTPVDQAKMYLHWSEIHSIELLFKFLVEKKYL